MFYNKSSNIQRQNENVQIQKQIQGQNNVKIATKAGKAPLISSQD